MSFTFFESLATSLPRAITLSSTENHLVFLQGRFPLWKISIGSGWTFFHFVLSTPPDQKKVENTSTLYHPGCGSQVQTGTENWYRKPMRGFNFVPILSDPMLIFLNGNRALFLVCPPSGNLVRKQYFLVGCKSKTRREDKCKMYNKLFYY